MAPHRGSFPARSRSLRRKTSWALGPGGTSVLVITASQSSILGAGSQPLVDGLTMVRLRGELLLRLSLASAVTGGFTGAFGVGLSTVAAFAIGVTALQTPLTDEDWDGWLYHRYFALGPGGVIDNSAAADADQVNATSAALRLEVDSKAMRKIPEGTNIFAAIEVVEFGTATMEADFNSRILVKIP